MPKSFDELRERLLRGGIAPRHVRRYLTELAEHFADLTVEEERRGRSRADAESAALLRLGKTEDLAQAMISRRELQSWCARAPWAMFGLAPLGLMAAAYFVACLILWSGWKIFLPGTSTPFVPIRGLASFYFGAGRWLYFGAPVLVGWSIALIAVRQRFKAIWPTAGLALIALIGAMAQVHASRPALTGGSEHVSMTFALGPNISNSVIHILVIFSLASLPYLIWRLKRAYSLPA